MQRQQINRNAGTVPVVMSLTAFLMVLATVVMGWDREQTDEGTKAHIFQLLVVVQVPFILAPLATAEWKKFVQVARPLALQVLTLGLALSSVAFFQTVTGGPHAPILSKHGARFWSVEACV
jgi:hypothetical protein